MILYRVCKEDEMNAILSGDMNNVGRYCMDTCVNNHKYDSDKKYLHFFTAYEHIFYLNLSEGFYICEYDIPDELLEGKLGIGVYTDLVKFKTSVNIAEYAIDASSIDLNYLLKAQRICKYLDIDDYFWGILDEDLELIYSKDGKKYEKTLC